MPEFDNCFPERHVPFCLLFHCPPAMTHFIEELSAGVPQELYAVSKLQPAQVPTVENRLFESATANRTCFNRSIAHN